MNCEEKEMVPLIYKELLSLIKSKKYVTYAKKSFVMIKISKANLNDTKKSEIVITRGNLE